MTTTLAIDPGKAIGLTWGQYSDTEPWRKTASAIWSFEELSERLGRWARYPDKLIIERFVPQSGAEYTLKEDDLAAVEVIGVLKYALVPYVNEVYWQTRSDKWDIPDELLKDHDLWVTGTHVKHTDGRDANDATIHSLHFMKNTVRHLPTLRRYWSGS